MDSLEYDNLRPVADLLLRLQEAISRFLDNANDVADAASQATSLIQAGVEREVADHETKAAVISRVPPTAGNSLLSFGADQQ